VQVWVARGGTFGGWEERTKPVGGFQVRAWGMFERGGCTLEGGGGPPKEGFGGRYPAPLKKKGGKSYVLCFKGVSGGKLPR